MRRSITIPAVAPRLALALSIWATGPAHGGDGGPATGWASWYGAGHQGRPTASGEIFRMERLTAAHRTLPFGTRVRITNLENGRSVEVTINDRGPAAAGRLIDLSAAAAAVLGIKARGMARVAVTSLAD